MGLLDDAIREHLELKRRHGADPAEVSRQEQEALGPVRRDAPTAAAEEPEAADALTADEPLPYDEEPEAEPYAEEDLPYAGEAEAPPPGAGPYDAAADLDDGAPTEYMEPPAAEPGDDEWGFDEDEEGPAEPGATAEPDEDVLEETPEFLQESPEHDRLWFEQKPPRDFDFDG